jgi:hypothetical protein
MDMKDTRLCQSISSEASSDPALSGLGFDWLSLISLLLPILQNLFQGCFPPADPPTPAATKEHLQEAYKDGQYDHSTLAPATRHAMRVAKQHGHKHHNKLTKEQAQALAIHTLDGIRTSADDVVQEAMSAS